MVKLSQGPGASGPSSSLGIMRFFDVDAGGPKVSPELVLGLAIVLTVGVILLRHFL